MDEPGGLSAPAPTRDSKSLKRDLETGEWQRAYAELLALDAYGAEYRLVIAG